VKSEKLKKISIGIIRQNNQFVLQRRPQEARIGAAGLIGCFGGQIKLDTDTNEPLETAQEAVAREVAEETTLTTLPAEWVELGFVEVDSDRDLKPIRIHATVFENRLAEDEEIYATEGTLVRMSKRELLASPDQISPATIEAFRKYI